MKQTTTIIFLVLIGGALIWSSIIEPLQYEKSVVIFNIVWGTLATLLGIVAVFFTARINERNAKYFEGLHRRTSLLMFKEMAEGSRSHNQFFVSKGVGLIFVAMGAIQIIRYLPLISL